MSKPRPIHLNKREALARAEGRLGCVVRPVPLDWARYDTDGVAGCEDEYGEHHDTIEWSPYRPGDVVPMKEAWRIIGWHDGEPLLIGYPADDGNREMRDSVADATEDWHVDRWTECSADMSAAGIEPDEDGVYYFESLADTIPTRLRRNITMPAGAVRYHDTVKAVECVRVSKMSTGGICRLDIPNKSTDDDPWVQMFDDWENYWQSRYGKKHPFDSAWAWVVTFEEHKGD